MPLVKASAKLQGETLTERMGSLIQAAGGPTKAAALVDASRDTMNNWKTGKSRIPFDAAFKLTRTAGVSMNWLATGIHRASAPGPGEAFTLVRRFDVTLAAGSGSATSDEVLDPMAFSTSWLETHIGTDKENLSVVQAKGDSMETTIQDGAMVLVDHTTEVIREDGIYAFRMDDSLFIKRVQTQLTGGVLLLSDNKAYPTQAVDDIQAAQFHILGRVRWVGNRL